MERILNFQAPLDIPLLDAVVGAFYSSDKVQVCHPRILYFLFKLIIYFYLSFNFPPFFDLFVSSLFNIVHK